MSKFARLQNACWLTGGILLLGCGPAQGPPPRPLADAILVPATELDETDVWPHLEGPIKPGRNYVFCATFQLAWNELRENVIKSPIEMDGGPPWISLLNEGSFDRFDLSEDCYLAVGGLVQAGTWREIRQAMHEKFPDAIFHVPELPAGATFFVYTYLFKSLVFEHAFHRLDGRLEMPLGNTKVSVAVFGIDHFDSDYELDELLGRQVSILDYESDDDFILSLEPYDDSDEIVLAKVAPGATLGKTIAAVKQRIAASTLEREELQPGESLRVPVVELGVTRNYGELLGYAFQNAGWKDVGLGLAQQRIAFRLDEWGAQLESDAATADSAAIEEPRHFDFDKPFLIYLQEESAKAPYFAMWIETAEVLETIRD